MFLRDWVRTYPSFNVASAPLTVFVVGCNSNNVFVVCCNWNNRIVADQQWNKLLLSFETELTFRSTIYSAHLAFVVFSHCVFFSVCQSLFLLVVVTVPWLSDLTSNKIHFLYLQWLKWCLLQDFETCRIWCWYWKLEALEKANESATNCVSLLV